MRRLRFLGLALAAVFVSAAALSTAAMAVEVPENLPALKAGEKRTYTGKNVGNTEFRAGGQSPVICTGATGEGTETKSAGPEGEFHIHFTGCETAVGGLKVKCTGLGDETGTILALGRWILVFDREKGKEFKELTTALLFINSPTHFSCSIVLIEVLEGETLCLHLKPTEENVTHEFHCLGGPKSTETAPVEEYSLTDKGVFKAPDLKASINHNDKEEVPALQLGLGTNTTTVKVFSMQ